MSTFVCDTISFFREIHLSTNKILVRIQFTNMFKYTIYEMLGCHLW